MVKLAANLTMLFNEVSPLERFARARAAGFRYAEFLFPLEHDVAAVTAALQESGLQLVLFNFAAGDRAAGDRGIASHPGRVAEFREDVARAVAAARQLGNQRLHCMAGMRLADISHDEQWRTFVENVRYAGEVCAGEGLTLLVEPLNDKDNPGYFLVGSAMGLRLVEEVGLPNVRLQYDIYHMQRGEGELAATIAANLGRIGHIQIADNPGRHQPGTGEINHRFLLPYLDRIGYEGYVALEYLPDGATEESLAWVGEYGLSL